jgi:hypothetical protein
MRPVFVLFAGDAFILPDTSVLTHIHSGVVGRADYVGGAEVDQIY